MEGLIQNAHTLFDERPSQSPPVPSSDVAETTPTHTYGSSFLSPELPQFAEVQVTGSTSRHRPGIVDDRPASTHSSFSSFLGFLSGESPYTTVVRPSEPSTWTFVIKDA